MKIERTMFDFHGEMIEHGLHDRAPHLADSKGLALDHLTVVYPGDRAYSIADRVVVVPLEALARRNAAIPLLHIQGGRRGKDSAIRK